MTRPLPRARRTAAALIGTAALVAGPLATSPADAAARPHADKPAKSAKAPQSGRTGHLLKAVAGKDRRLARLSTSNAVTRLDDAYEGDVVAGIEESRTALAAIRTAVEAADSTFDTRAAARQLRAFRVENHRLVITVVAQADRILDAAVLAGDTVTAAAATSAIEAALEVTATSAKSVIKAARAELHAAEDAEDAEDDTTEDTTEDTDTTGDSTAPVS